MKFLLKIVCGMLILLCGNAAFARVDFEKFSCGVELSVPAKKLVKEMQMTLLDRGKNLHESDFESLESYLNLSMEFLLSSLEPNATNRFHAEDLHCADLRDYSKIASESALELMQAQNAKLEAIFKKHKIRVPAEKIESCLVKTTELLRNFSQIKARFSSTKSAFPLFENFDEDELFFCRNAISFLLEIDSSPSMCERFWVVEDVCRAKLAFGKTAKSFIYLVYLAEVYDTDGGASLLSHEAIQFALKNNPAADATIVPARFLRKFD